MLRQDMSSILIAIMRKIINMKIKLAFFCKYIKSTKFIYFFYAALENWFECDPQFGYIGWLSFPAKTIVPVVSSLIMNKNGRSALNSSSVNLSATLTSLASNDVLPFSLISMPIFCKIFDTCKRSWTWVPRTSCGSDACFVKTWRIPSYIKDTNVITILVTKKAFRVVTSFKISLNSTAFENLNLGNETSTSLILIKIWAR